MAQPTNKIQFKEFCLRKLGKPVIEINVDDDQVDDRIDEALSYYQDYHFDGVEKTHKFGYELNGKKHQIESSLVVKGENQTFTAMAKTVGLPVAIATLKILNKEIKTPGVQLPITKEVYAPILKELEQYGIKFTEKKVPYLGYNPENVIG